MNDQLVVDVKSEPGSYDAVVVGAGCGGLYAMHKLRNSLSLRLTNRRSSMAQSYSWTGAISQTDLSARTQA
ncbi:MAG: hypothetical protein HYX38_07065 [Rhodospirillales bacterium]|nr:hypothetical protein [Rhodospirillales bacterium]